MCHWGPSHLLTFADCLRPLQAAFHWTTHIQLPIKNGAEHPNWNLKVQMNLSFGGRRSAPVVGGNCGDWQTWQTFFAQRKGVTHMGFCCKLEEFRNGSQLIWRLGPVHNLQLLPTSDGRTLWDTARGAKLFFEMPPFAGETLAWRGRLVQASVHTTSFETAFRSE